MSTSSTVGLYNHLVQAQRARSSLFRFADTMRRKAAPVTDDSTLSGPSFRELTPGLDTELHQASLRD